MEDYLLSEGRFVPRRRWPVLLRIRLRSVDKRQHGVL